MWDKLCVLNALGRLWPLVLQDEFCFSGVCTSEVQGIKGISWDLRGKRGHCEGASAALGESKMHFNELDECPSLPWISGHQEEQSSPGKFPCFVASSFCCCTTW